MNPRGCSILQKIYKIGLTGGIGCGKSEVRKQLANHGLPTIDADSLAKSIAATDERAIAAIKRAFGDAVFGQDGALQREILAAKVFGDAQALARLNAILHPLVFEYVDSEIEKIARSDAHLVVIEAALFYESGWHTQMDRMIVVTAPAEKRLAWLKARDGVSEAQIRARMAHQMPVEQKVALADFVIDNNGSLADLQRAVDRATIWLQAQTLQDF